MLPTNIYPWTNFHELNLEWILAVLKEIETTMTQFVAINSLKYADPIQWDITRQYEKNTIVIDPLTGTAYISVQPVPIGVIITNTDYWSVVFDLQRFVTKANTNFTLRVETQTTLNATFPTPLNGWLVWGDTLYKALTNIVAGDQYVENSNIERITVESIVGHPEELTTLVKTNLVAAINELVTACANLDTKIDTVSGDLATLSTADKTNLVAAINEVLTTLNTICGNLANLNTADKTNLVAAVNEVLTTIDTICGNLANLNTADKTNLVAAVNEVLTTINTICGDLADLDTTDKTNLVAAINEILATMGDLKMYHISDSSRNYIDCVNGDDSNPGTMDAPWKTLIPLFEQANDSSKGTVDIRAYLVTAGSYILPSKNFYSNMSLHITGSVAGCVIEVPIDTTLHFYECHFNFRNVTFNGTNSVINPEGCTLTTDSVTSIGCEWDVFSSLGTMTALSFDRQLKIRDSTVKLSAPNCQNTDPTLDAIYVEQSYVILRGSSTMASLNNDGAGNAFLKCYESIIMWNITYRDMTYKYQWAINAMSCTIYVSRSQYRNMIARSQQGINNYGSGVLGQPLELVIGESDQLILTGTDKSGLTAAITVASGATVTRTLSYAQTVSTAPNVFTTLCATTAPASSPNISITVSNISSTSATLTLTNHGDSSATVTVQWLVKDNLS